MFNRETFLCQKQYLLTCKVTGYCFFALHSNIIACEVDVVFFRWLFVVKLLVVGVFYPAISGVSLPGGSTCPGADGRCASFTPSNPVSVG